MSRSPWPSRLNPSVTSMMATPGKSTTWGLVDRYERPLASMAPHSGPGGCTPSPRKLRLDARSSAVAIRRFACTISGDRTLGSTCPREDAGLRGALRDGRLDELRGPKRQGGRVPDPGERRDGVDGHGDDQVDGAHAKDGDGHEGDEESRQSQEHVDRAHRHHLH